MGTEYKCLVVEDKFYFCMDHLIMRIKDIKEDKLQQYKQKFYDNVAYGKKNVKKFREFMQNAEENGAIHRYNNNKIHIRSDFVSVFICYILEDFRFSLLVSKVIEYFWIEQNGKFEETCKLMREEIAHKNYLRNVERLDNLRLNMYRENFLKCIKIGVSESTSVPERVEEVFTNFINLDLLDEVNFQQHLVNGEQAQNAFPWEDRALVESVFREVLVSQKLADGRTQFESQLFRESLSKTDLNGVTKFQLHYSEEVDRLIERLKEKEIEFRKNRHEKAFL